MDTSWGDSHVGRYSTARILTSLSLLTVLLILYGSWIPFDFSMHAARADGRFAGLIWHAPTLEDAITNVVIYVPLGLFFTLRWWLADTRRRWAGLISLLMGLMVSGLAETVQLWIRSRVGSYTDMTFNLVGVILGVILARPAWWGWKRMFGPRGGNSAGNPMRVFYALLLTMTVVSQWAPFDVAIFPGGFQRAIASAQWSVTDSWRLLSSGSVEHDMMKFGSVFLFVLLGIFGVLAARSQGRSFVRSVVGTGFRLVLWAGVLELGQMFISSHTCDVLDFLMEGVGGIAGALVGRGVVDYMMKFRPANGDRVVHALWIAALVVQIGVVVGMAMPVEGLVRMFSWRAIQWMPFHSHFQQPFGLAIGRIASSLTAYAVLALLAMLVIGRSRSVWTGVVALVLTVGVVIFSEGIQAFSVSRHADMTEPVLALLAAGGMIGWWRGVVAQRIQNSEKGALSDLIARVDPGSNVREEVIFGPSFGQ